MSAARKFGATHEVFYIAELVDLICGFLGKEHCVGLMHTSRQLSHSTMAIVWKDVELESLLLLIPGTLVEEGVHSVGFPSGYFGPADATTKRLQFTAQADFTRFDIYAPFVKHLRAASLYLDGDFPDHTTHAICHALLPNLQHLSTTALGLYCLRCLNWIPKLLPTSLLSFQVFSTTEGSLPSLDHVTCFDLMRNLCLACPRLQKLDIFPEFYSSTIVDSFYHPLSKMTHLRSLVCSGWMLYHKAALQYFGQLPLLEEIALIWDYLPEPVPSTPDYFALSEDSFPALRHLEIRKLNPSMISYLCSLRPLFRNLTKLTAIYPFSYYDTSDDGANEEARTRNVILPLGSSSLQLTDLNIATRGNYGSVRISNSVLEALKKLPLLCLDVISIELEPEIGWDHFARALPHLQELHIRWQMLEFEPLEAFAHALPNLRLLVFRSLLFDLLDPYRPKGDHKSSERHLQPFTIRATFQLEDVSVGRIKYIADYLYDLWPGCVWEPHTPDSQENKAAADRFNQSISHLRLNMT